MKKAMPAHFKSRKEKEGFKIGVEPLISTKSDEECNKLAEGDNAPTSAQTSEFPTTFYGTNSLFLVAQGPFWLFAYWDIDISHHPGGTTFLRCIQADQSLESEIEVSFEVRNWYIPVSKSGTGYFVDLGYYRESKWQSIAQSEVIQTPPNQISSSESFDYATVPLSLSLQELIKYFQSSIRSGENLIEALGRIQKEARSFQLSTADVSHLSEEERSMLEFLIGKELLNSSSLSTLNTNQLQEKIRQQLEKYLQSQSSNKENPLNSASFLNNELSSWNTEALSSWENKSDAESETDKQEEFFMYVNAEVIFYGNTHPGASITIDSKPVKVNPDGSFHFHFIFPDEAYEVPVVSQSPDGLETRSAVLRFHRTSSSSPKEDNSEK